MRLKPIFFFAVVGALAAFLVLRQAGQSGKPGVINIGQLAPDFTIKDQSGKEIKLSDFRGQLVFLNFWATWCVPCIDEMPDMEVVNREFKDRKFKMIAVSVDTDWDVVSDFYKEHHLTLPTYLDPGRKVYTAYHATGVPETFIMDRNGYVVKYIIGPRKWADPQEMTQLETLIRDQENKGATEHASLQ
jgi:peroxiredoxin